HRTASAVHLWAARGEFHRNADAAANTSGRHMRGSWPSRETHLRLSTALGPNRALTGFATFLKDVPGARLSRKPPPRPDPWLGEVCRWPAICGPHQAPGSREGPKIAPLTSVIVTR